MKSLLVVGTAILWVGVIMALFGAIHSTNLPPSYTALGTGNYEVNFVATNYTLNFIGIVLVLLGVVVVVRGYRRN